MAKAHIRQHNGAPAIIVDGVPCPPMTITVSGGGGMAPDERKAYFRKLGESGLKIFYVSCSTRWHNPGNADKGVPDGVAATLRDIRFVLDAVPDGWVMLRLNVSPPRDWVNAHPEEQFTYGDATGRREHRKVICTSVGGEPIDGMHSLCSQKWREEGEKTVADFFGELSRHPEFSRVIGTFLCAGGTGEWYYPLGLQTEDGLYGDFSEPFRAEYEAFLRRKYGTVEELRRVWMRPDATFEHPAIPTPEERAFVEKADAKIVKALREWETEGRVIGLKLDMNAREPTNTGVFLNANGYAHVADFYTAWHLSTAHTIVHFAKALKRFSKDLLVGAFYGSYGCQSYFDGGTASGTPAILDSGVVDFLAAPGVYNNREPGGIVAQREMQDSFRLRNLIYVCEDDSRTHLCKPWMQRDAMALYTVADSVNTLKRDFARDICEDIHGWWFDMGCGWYNDPEILSLFKRQREIADFAYALDRTKKNEIALIYDTESVHCVSQYTSQMVLDFYRTSDLGRIGAPVDYYFHDDLARADMPDYKLYVMLNQYYLTDAEREAIYAKAKRNGATILWLYAPGFINPGAGRVMDVANVEKTVGMKLGFIDKTFFPHFRVNPSAHPALALASPSRRYGVIDADVHSNIWLGSVLQPAYANPGFYIDDPEATVLGRYCCNGLPALAMVGKDGAKSIYCASHIVQADLLASIAAYSGCHLFARPGDVLYANENFVVLHAKDDGPRTIRFKRPCSPYEVYEKRYYGHGTDHIDVEMTLGQTLMWSTAGEC